GSALALVQDHGFTLELVRPEYLINQISGGFRPAFLDLKLQNPLTDIGRTDLYLGTNQCASFPQRIQPGRKFCGRRWSSGRISSPNASHSKCRSQRCQSEKPSHNRRYMERINFARSNFFHPACKAWLGFSRELRHAG